MPYRLLLLLCFLPALLPAQRRDTVQRYLSEELALVGRSEASYGAVSIREKDHWLLFAVYPDGQPLLRCYFKDKALTIKDGPFSLYHPGSIKAAEGFYIDNIQQGIWKFRYPNGQLKDSGMTRNNYMTDQWLSWYPSGALKSKAGFIPSDSLTNDDPTPFSTSTNRGILNGDTTLAVNHGPWQYFHENGEQKEAGQYYKGRKEGWWTYQYNTGKPESAGRYIADWKQGEWTFYRENGQLSAKEIYKNNKVVSMQCFDEEGKLTGDFCSVLKPPVAVLDRWVDFDTYMLDHLFWPKELEGKSVNGTVRFQYTITVEGKLTEFKVVSTPHELLGKEVERFFLSIEKWSPAISHNRVIPFTATREIPFLR